MRSINDLHIVAFDYITAKDDQVSLRYSAEGSHNGEPYKGKAELRSCSILLLFLFRYSSDWTQSQMDCGWLIPIRKRQDYIVSKH